MKYITLHETQAAYDAAKSNLILPNVSLITENNKVEYNPYVPPLPIVVATFNVTSTSEPTAISYKNIIEFMPIFSVDGTSGFSEIEIDGVVQPTIETAYTFNTLGEHTVKYTLVDPTRIGDAAFTNCYNLVGVEIPNSVTSIGINVFNGCTSLTSIEIPSGVTSIGNSAFNSCFSLTSIAIPSGVTSIAYGTFGVCSGLTSIDIPDSVTSIGDSAFANCRSLTSIEIPSGVTSIGESAFNSCFSLTSIAIPSGVTSIGESAFNSCSGLTSIIVEALTPPSLGGYGTFGFTNDCPIYVPSSSVDAYKAAQYWSDCASRIQAIQ